MQQALLNLPTTCTTDLKATTADVKVPAALPGDSSFGALLSQAIDDASAQGASAGNVAQVKNSSPLDLVGLLSLLLGNDAAASGQTVLPTALPAALQTAGDGGLKGPGDESAVTSDEWLQGAAATAAGGTLDAGTAASTNIKSGQQLQDLIMGLLALVMRKGAGAQQAAATDANSAEEKAAAEQGSGITTGMNDTESTGPSERGKTSSSSSTSTGTSETENRHLLDTLALLLFTGIEAAKQVPVKESGASGETQSLPAADGRTEREITAAALLRTAGGPAAGSTGTSSGETVASSGG